MAISPQQASQNSAIPLQPIADKIEEFFDQQLSSGKRDSIMLRWREFAPPNLGLASKQAIRLHLRQKYISAGWDRVMIDTGDQRDQIAEEEYWTFAAQTPQGY